MRLSRWAAALLAVLPQANAATELTVEGWTFLSLAVVVGAGVLVALFLPRMHLKDLQESRTASVVLLLIVGILYIATLVVPWTGSYGDGALLWAFRHDPLPGGSDTTFLYTQEPEFASQYLLWFALPLWIVAAGLTVAAGFRLLGEEVHRATTSARLAALAAIPAIAFFVLGIDLDGRLSFGAGLVVALVALLGTGAIGLASKERPPRIAPDEAPPAEPAFQDVPDDEGGFETVDEKAA